MAIAERELRDVAGEVAGLDALDAFDAGPPRRARLWRSAWPKLAAIVLGLGIWQAVVWSRWKPDYVLPGPGTVLPRLGHELGKATTWRALGITGQRAGVGFAVSLVIGVVVGALVARSRILRSAVGSFITGLQTMPSIAWFPLSILLFKLTDRAILFVVVLGAAPSIANGVISGIDHIPPILLRAGRVLGARGLSSYRHVILPAALPAFLAGLKQGWAFLWRSLMAGELFVMIANRPNVGLRLNQEFEMADTVGLISWMLIVLVIGIVVDAFGFGLLERAVRRRRGLLS
ncbi:MAG: ABC transporter permease [Acidimicrobiales bacterium]